MNTQTTTPPEAVQSPPLVAVLTKEQLSIKVENLVRRDKMSYLESIIQVCDETGIDPDDMAKLVVGSLKEKLEAEAQRNNILPRTNTLFED